MYGNLEANKIDITAWISHSLEYAEMKVSLIRKCNTSDSWKTGEYGQGKKSISQWQSKEEGLNIKNAKNK